MKRLYIIFLIPILTLSAQGQKRFYNLTAEEVRIDSVLPQVVYSQPLPQGYSDSVYSLQLKYPEFIDMSARDVEKYKSIAGNHLPGNIPLTDDFITIDRKKPYFTSTFCPVVFRNGKYQWMVSFMAELVSAPRTTQPARAKGETRAEESPSQDTPRYASHSVLSTGKWAKIRVAESGIHQLTDETIRKAGFSTPAKVKIYGYGGNLIPEILTDDYLREYDDLKEVPTCTAGGKRLFYAKGTVSWSDNETDKRTRNPYSDYGYYFITETDGSPLTCTEEELTATAAASAGNTHSLYEKDEFAWYQGGRNLFGAATIENQGKRTYNLSVPAGNDKARITVATTAGSATTVLVSLNDSLIGSQSMTLSKYDKGNEAVNTWNVSNVQPDNNITVELKSGGPVHLDYISFVFDTPRTVPSLTSHDFPKAEYVHNITNQDLHSDEGYDMVITRSSIC